MGFSLSEKKLSYFAHMHRALGSRASRDAFVAGLKPPPLA
jgi:hypothetical protein